MISMNKKYRCNGSPMRILCIDAGGRLPVIGLFDSGTVLYFTAEGLHDKHVYHIVEVGPYDEFVIDEPVMVRDDHSHTWRRCHFAGIKQDGRALAWNFGLTKWASITESTGWNHCRRPTAEELSS